MKKLSLIVIIAVISVLLINCSKPEIEGQSIDGWNITGNANSSYILGKETDKYNNQTVYFIRSKENVDSGFGAAVKYIIPANYIGKKVRLSGFIKTDNLDNWAGMWMRVDAYEEGKMLAFDNMMNRPIKGNTDWKKYDIVLDVPEESQMIVYGFLVSGNGKAWFTEPAFETAGNDEVSTNILPDEYFKGSENFSDLPPELKDIPDGIEVKHDPQTVTAELSPADTMYYWVYKTTVKPMKEDLEITEFGSYAWYYNHWGFSTVTGKPFEKKDFAEWYNCTDGKMKKGSVYIDTSNWNRWQTLQKGKVLWYYIGKNSKGEKFKGTAIVDYLAELKNK